MEGSTDQFLSLVEKNPQGVRGIPRRPVRSFTDMCKYFADISDDE